MSKSELIGHKFEVLDHGHVVLMDYMGSDQDIVQAARTSYQKGTKKVSDDRTLLRYLIRHNHTSPLESAVVKLHIKLPIFIERQWARHRTAGWNEVSARYSELPEETYLPLPEDVCQQSKVNNQGRGQEMEEYANEFIAASALNSERCFETYHKDLENGVARELSRINLPLSTYTEKVWWCNLHNLLHFLGLRMNEHAQKEIRDFADVIGYEIVSKLFPITWKAFCQYRLNAIQLTELDIRAITNIQRGVDRDTTLEAVFNNKRERQECLDKLNILGIG